MTPIFCENPDTEMTLFNQVCTLLLHNLALVTVKFSTAYSDLNSICVNEVMISVRLHVDIDIVFENLFSCSRLKNDVIH